MKELRPRLWDLRVSYELLSRSNYEVARLPDAAFRALMELVSAVGAGLVWTYSEPGDGSLPDDDDYFRRVAGLSMRRWRKVRPELEPFFVIKGGRWHLDRPWLAVDLGPSRFAIPRAIKEEVAAREGQACTYCGDTAGPFDFDHILPVSRGGGNDPSNLTLACASCNRSKGGRTLREWFACS